MKINNISLGWVTTDHIDKARKFFHDDLGLEITSDHSEMGWIEFAPKGTYGMLLAVAQAQPKESHKPGDNTVLTFEVDNLEQAIKELKAKGVKFEGEIMEVPGHVRIITFFDGDHNMFQLVQKLGEF